MFLVFRPTVDPQWVRVADRTGLQVGDYFFSSEVPFFYKVTFDGYDRVSSITVADANKFRAASSPRREDLKAMGAGFSPEWYLQVWNLIIQPLQVSLAAEVCASLAGQAGASIQIQQLQARLTELTGDFQTAQVSLSRIKHS